MNSARLYLVRHGAVVRAAGKSYIGQSEAALSDEGVEQARALRKWLEPIAFENAYSSSLSRARRTCGIIVGPRSMEIVPALSEIKLGDWEGVSFTEIENRCPEEFAARGRDLENWRPPGGESFADCRARAMSALRAILSHAHGNILVVAHAGVNRLILCDILGIPIANLHTIGQDYGCVNIIEFSAGRSRLKLLNYTPLSPFPVEQKPRSEELLGANR